MSGGSDSGIAVIFISAIQSMTHFYGSKLDRLSIDPFHINAEQSDHLHSFFW